MIEFTYIEPKGGNTERKQFKTWKSVDKFVRSRKINKYKVKGQSESRRSIIKYTSVGWEEYMAKALNKLKGI